MLFVHCILVNILKIYQVVPYQPARWIKGAVGWTRQCKMMKTLVLEGIETMWNSYPPGAFAHLTLTSGQVCG